MNAPDVAGALEALWRGAFGSRYVFFSATLVRAVPLTLPGLAVAVAFRAGVLNIGAEGQFLAGATAAAGVGLLIASWARPAQEFIALPLALCAGAATRSAWAGIAAW